jgi:hypothetical protein
MKQNSMDRRNWRGLTPVNIQSKDATPLLNTLAPWPWLGYFNLVGLSAIPSAIRAAASLHNFYIQRSRNDGHY